MAAQELRLSRQQCRFRLHASFEETSETDFDRLMNVHLKGPFFLTQKLLPLIADGGRILNVSSGSRVSRFRAMALQTALGRPGLPEGIGDVIASLLSSESGWINAQRIEASGGMFI
jgi:NAD(P)-dependent dehydrogenase (short-subunit alcohol dehydrogenase family)